MIGVDTADDEGRVIDLHALRTTLGTKLARAGVAPQIAQRLMRHSDYKTTLRHYTVLGLTDTAGAIQSIPLIEAAAQVNQQQATGTDDMTPRRELANPLATPRENRHKVAATGTRDNRRGDDARARESPDFQAENAVEASEMGMARGGIEPPTLRFSVACSTN